MSMAIAKPAKSYEAWRTSPADGNRLALIFGPVAGDSLVLRPGTLHEFENTGPDRLYCLTIMVPDDQFATLIRSGGRAELDAEDMDVLGRFGQ